MLVGPLRTEKHRLTRDRAEMIRYSGHHFVQIKSAQEVLMPMASVVVPLNVATSLLLGGPGGSPEASCRCTAHADESTHLHEGFGPDSGAHLQDNTGSSLQEANVTLQLPALHQRARLQEDEATHGRVSIAHSVPRRHFVLTGDFGLIRINLAAHLADAESFLKLYISAAVSIFGAGVSTNLWCSPDHTQSVWVLMSICVPM